MRFNFCYQDRLHLLLNRDGQFPVTVVAHEIGYIRSPTKDSYLTWDVVRHVVLLLFNISLLNHMLKITCEAWYIDSPG